MNNQNGTARFSAWRKSSHSNANGNNCVEVAWRKSSHSHPNNQCVEVAVGSAVVGLRDSKNPDGPTVTLPQARWSGFLAELTR